MPADTPRDILPGSGIFSLLTETEAEKFFTILKRKSFARGETIFTEGDRGREMFIVESGLVVSRTVLPNGMSLDIARFGPGDFFGDMSIFENAPRSATCHALEASVLFRLNDLIFQDFTEAYPEIATKIMFRMLNIITERLREKSNFLGNMVEWGDRANKRAITDEISCIYNRRFLDDALEKYFKKSENSGKPLSLMMIDIDDFSKFDDLCSNEEVNQIIRALIESIRKNLGENDILARYGGDEFSIILPERALEPAAEIARGIGESVAATALDGIGKLTDQRVTISIGVASYPDDAADLDGLRTAADRRLYAAKKAGKNRVHDGDFSSS